MTNSNQSLIEKLEAELDAPVYEGCDYRSGLRKAITIIRAHQSEPLMEVVNRVARAIHDKRLPESNWDEFKKNNKIERYIEQAKAAIAAMNDYAGVSGDGCTASAVGFDSQAPAPVQCSEIIGTPQDRRVVCAALMDDSGRLILSPRHFDKICHETIALIGGDWKAADQGFVDQWGHFMDRERAFIVAKASGQIRRKTGNPDSQELFSEDLY